MSYYIYIPMLVPFYVLIKVDVIFNVICRVVDTLFNLFFSFIVLAKKNT